MSVITIFVVLLLLVVFDSIMTTCRNTLSWQSVMHDTLSRRTTCDDNMWLQRVMTTCHDTLSWHVIMTMCHARHVVMTDTLSWHIVTTTCHDNVSWHLVTTTCHGTLWWQCVMTCHDNVLRHVVMTRSHDNVSWQRVCHDSVWWWVSEAVLFRIAFVGAREGRFPVAVSLINYKRFTPVPALIIGVRWLLHWLLILLVWNIYSFYNNNDSGHSRVCHDVNPRIRLSSNPSYSSYIRQPLAHTTLSFHSSTLLITASTSGNPPSASDSFTLNHFSAFLLFGATCF